MITISREYRFEAAHFLPYVPDGHKCKKMHGHSYRIVITVIGKGQHGGLDNRGFVMDFAELDAIVAPLIKLVDHTVLNETMISNPTAELIACWFASGVLVADRVTVFEERGAWASWSRANGSDDFLGALSRG